MKPIVSESEDVLLFEILHLPQSSRTVFGILRNGEAMTHKEIVRKSQLSPRTVRNALKILYNHHLVIKQFNIQDARMILYILRSIWSPKPVSPNCRLSGRYDVGPAFGKQQSEG